MKIFKSVLFVLLTTLFCSSQLHAQKSLFDLKDLSNTKIDNYSDAELINFYSKASESGISESQLYNLVSDRGLPEVEIAKLKNRLEIINAKNKPENNAKSIDKTNIDESYNYDT